jgi:hypothetical protein
VVEEELAVLHGDGLAAHRAVKRAGDEQDRVADFLGLEAAEGEVGEEFVLGVRG